MRLFLLLSVCTVAICGLVYELLIATLASYLLGDSITHFSTIIGTYLFAMGVGSYLSRYVGEEILKVFIRVELLVATFGGFSASILYMLFPFASNLYLPLYLLVFIIGTGVGLEIPLLMRMIKEEMEFSKLVSTVLSFDYIGALFASLVFPLVCVPYLGLVRTAFFFGILNCLLAIALILVSEKKLKKYRLDFFIASAVLLILGLGFVSSDLIIKISEAQAFSEPVLYSKDTPYQRLVLTRKDSDIRLYLNGQLQFSSRDEYRYHEALVHVGLSSIENPENVLILGGGDGLALREVFKYPSIKKVTLVDLDPSMVNLFKSSEILVGLNKNSLNDPRLEVINQDAFKWIKNREEKFDFIIIDFPDPTSFSLGKLYSDYFYKGISRLLSEKGLLVVQSTSPLIARKSFWMLVHTMESVGLKVAPYHVYVPSFTEWGYVMAGKNDFKPYQPKVSGLQFIEAKLIDQLFYFPPDMSEVSTGIQSLSNQALISTYQEEWGDRT
jgi:spermidine synthase